jgi:uncharacterized phiE125 gp8 family phage protein
VLTVTQVPDTIPVALDLAKKHLRLDSDDENDQLEIYLRAAIDYVQSATTRILAPTEFDYRVHLHGRRIDLPRSPVREVIEVSAIEDGVATPMALSDWRHVPASSGGRVELSSFHDGTIGVVFTAGYDLPGQTGSGDDPAFRRPDLAVAVVLLLTGHWFEHREAVSDVQTYPLPFAVDAILQQLRIYR